MFMDFAAPDDVNKSLEDFSYISVFNDEFIIKQFLALVDIFI